MPKTKRSSYFDEIKKNRNLTIALFALIIVGFIVYGVYTGNKSQGFEAGENFIRISGPEGSNYSKTIEYNNVVSVEVKNDENYQLGECVQGEQTKKLIYGTWVNEQYGEYTLYVVPKLTTYCVLTTTDGVVVLNLESNRTTAELGKALQSQVAGSK